MTDPAVIKETDYLVLESTYGDRCHDKEDPEIQLEDIIRRTAARGGTVVIPAFAVGRAQLLLWYLYRLKQQGRLPANRPIYLDSPMSVNAVDIYRAHPGDLRLSEADHAAAINIAPSVQDKPTHTSLMMRVLDIAQYTCLIKEYAKWATYRV